MDPEQLGRWEPILSSQVAVSLLLLAGLVTISGLLLSWVRVLYRENRELHREFREYLKASAAFAVAYENARKLLDLEGEGP